MKREKPSGRPKHGYALRNGERVPGVTTIVGRFKDAGALIHWAWKQGKSGLDYRATRDGAASAGSICHDMIHAWVRHEDWKPDPEANMDHVSLAAVAFGGFMSWAVGSELQVVAAETPMVSERHAFGGTPDVIGRLNGGELAVIDWKTGNSGPYVDWLVQCGAYALLWEELHGERPARAHVVRLNKDTGSVAHHQWSAGDLERGARMFLLLREAYELDFQLRKAV